LDRVLQRAGRFEPLNAVATRSEDGQTLHFKAVNPTDQAVHVELILGESGAGKATLQVVAPGSLHARNTLDARDVVRPESAKVQQQGSTLRFTLPPTVRYSLVGVVLGELSVPAHSRRFRSVAPAARISPSKTAQNSPVNNRVTACSKLSHPSTPAM